MGNLLSERLKVDTQLVSEDLAAASDAIYYNMKKYRKALFVWEIGAMAAAATSVGAAWEARDDAATGAQAIAAITATMTANINVAEATLTLATVLNTEAVTINGLVFTAHTDTTTVADREFAIDGNDTADAVELCVCINDPVYGVPGVTATSALGVVTLVATELGEEDITITDAAAGTITPATIRAIGYLEVDHTMMTKATGAVAAYTHVGFIVTNSGAMLTGGVLIRGNNRYTPTQYVGAADTA